VYVYVYVWCVCVCVCVCVFVYRSLGLGIITSRCIPNFLADSKQQVRNIKNTTPKQII